MKTTTKSIESKDDGMKVRTSKAPQPASLDRPDIAALAAMYWKPPETGLLREELLDHARRALAKYALEPEQLDDAAPLLASAMHMLIEQNGGRPLPPDYAEEIEHHVLGWCGLMRESCEPPQDSKRYYYAPQCTRPFDRRKYEFPR